MSQHGIVREIGIDAAHRVPLTDSKCKHVHGHRYKIEAHCRGPLATEGATQGMAGGLDFSFVKDEMMKVIDENCDHGMILWAHDPFVQQVLPTMDWKHLDRLMQEDGYSLIVGDQMIGTRSFPVKIYLVPFAPTAEELARHWYLRLSPRIIERSKNTATLTRVVVWETPNCRAVYPL